MRSVAQTTVRSPPCWRGPPGGAEEHPEGRVVEHVDPVEVDGDPLTWMVGSQAEETVLKARERRQVD